MLYLKSIELNYSHEQMTPLNSILANSKIAYKRFLDMWNEQNLWLDFENDEHQLKNYRTREAKNEESLMILKGI